ncbi:hypothetical protein V3481_018857 [Fusarium oxysporum f. sp. vasinfectum]
MASKYILFFREICHIVSPRLLWHTGCMTKKNENLDKIDCERNFVTDSEYDPVQGGIKQTNFSHVFSYKSRVSRRVKIPRQAWQGVVKGTKIAAKQLKPPVGRELDERVEEGVNPLT